MAVASFNLTLLGADLHRRRRGEPSESETPASAQPNQAAPESRSTRHSRRATSYYNAFQTTCTVSNDAPPSYAAAARGPPRQPVACMKGGEPLPNYSCTVAAEAKLLLSLESDSPLHGTAEGDWREVYAVIRGTMISFHRVKDGGAGKLLRSYTLQHAEVGLAPDAQHTILVPQSRFAHLVPSAARRRAWQKDPDLFKAVRQNILRLRVETDQILLADSCEERIHQFIHALSAAIDISYAIDERNIPRQCTVPRRRRRARPQFQGNLGDPALLAEQERIFRQMYPSFAGPRPETHGSMTTDARPAAPTTPVREEDEVDLSMIREEAPAPLRAAEAHPSDDAAVSSRPGTVRQTTQSSINSTFSGTMMYATPVANFDADGKWQPPHVRTAAQVQRYIRRCMPILLADSTRASDIVITNGKRMKINWRMELLEPFELQPPSYKAHHFESAPGMVRQASQKSMSDSATHADPLSSSSMLGSGEDQDHISPAETAMENLQLSKVASHTTTTKGALPRGNGDLKTGGPTHIVPDIHGAVFCF